MSTPTESFLAALRAVLDVNLIRTAMSGASMGVLLHVTILRVVEIENFLFQFLGFLSASTVAFLTAYLASGFPVVDSIKRVFLLNTGFYIALFCSIAAYRVFFHRLRHFPGPAGAKVSRFYTASIASKKIQYYKEVDKLHQKYGDFVRTGMLLLQKRGVISCQLTVRSLFLALFYKAPVSSASCENPPSPCNTVRIPNV